MTSDHGDRDNARAASASDRRAAAEAAELLIDQIFDDDGLYAAVGGFRPRHPCRPGGGPCL
jgi:hypothetical protein